MNNIPVEPTTTELRRCQAVEVLNPTLKDTIEDHQQKLFHLASLLKCLAGVDEDFGAGLVHDMRIAIGDAANTASALAAGIYEWDIAFQKINEQEVLKCKKTLTR